MRKYFLSTENKTKPYIAEGVATMFYNILRKKKKSILLIVLFVAGLSGELNAGGQNRAGTSAAPELLIPIGARYLSMGGAPVAFASGVEAIYWNPAGVDRTTKSVNAMFSHRSYIADIALSYLAVSSKFDFGTLALSLRTLDIGDIAVTTETAPDGTGEIFSPTFFVAGLTYSGQLTDRISVGITTNLISENFAQVNSSGFAIDAGVQYNGFLTISGLDIGVAMKNIGPAMQYGGPGLWVSANVPGAGRGVTFYKVEAAPFELPSVVEIGAAYHYSFEENNDLTVSSTFQNNNFAYDEYRIGVEYSYDDMLFLRGGYLVGAGVADLRPHIFENYTIGAGVNFIDLGGTDLSVDYAFVPVEFFDNNHVIAIKIGF